MAIVSIPLEGDDSVTSKISVVYVEVDAAPDEISDWSSDEVRETRAQKAIQAASDILDDAVELARACAEKFDAGLAQVREGTRAPDEVCLQLGIKLDAEVGAMLAKTRAGAQLQVSLTWKRAK